jgi:NADH:ubiquinone oxidoreductase subunit 5 (subunit L)/multisubunit Na+/H+ antiporter MnhA subunit
MERGVADTIWLEAILARLEGAPLARQNVWIVPPLLFFALMIAGLGVKSALVPLHGWLPVAMVAPAPVSALLHAVAVVKAGAFDHLGARTVLLASLEAAMKWLGEHYAVDHNPGLDSKIDAPNAR